MKNKKSVLRGLIYSSLAIALLLSPFIGFAVKERIASKAVLTEFGKAVEARDYGKAYKLTDPDFQSVTSFDQFVNQHRELQSNYGILQKLEQSTGGVEYEGFSGFWQAKILANLQYERRQITLLYTLRKQGGRWMVRGYQRTE